MEYTTLGRTDIKVSKVCLGTMTFGQQNTQQEAEDQLDYALEQGINFVDTAELYSVPPKPKTQGSTETIIGNWLAKRNNRNQIVLASKVIGKGTWLPWIREGNGHPNKTQIKEAIAGSLKRLQTDYLDLYQIHWPDRATNYFGQLGYTQVDDEESSTPILETLEALDELVQEGMIRAAGVSNETPWGLMQYLAHSDQGNLTRIASIQNPYSLLNRSFEIGLAEFAHREDVGLLAYSPLAFGALSGKYRNGAQPEGARLTRWGHYFTRYLSPRARQATEAYAKLAEDNGLSPAAMALSFVSSRPFLTSNIIGATNMEQLRENIAATQSELDASVLGKIEELYIEFQTAAP